ncbi:beta-1,3-galactosyltransferase 5-like [Styela clava]|uniref:beta-1,3-galactosyltransferase 5-like n=1 Tax=Styela clava TaxID=7725 RepID=UPI00193A2BE5|nr:beta-1,3-galactosyltransferase 5-like [Styela clava]
MEVKKLRILLLILIGFTCLGIIRLTTLYEELVPSKLYKLGTQTSAYGSVTSAGEIPVEYFRLEPQHRIEWHQVLKFNFSVEPDTNRRRIPTRFWINSLQEVNHDLDFVLTPRATKCRPDTQVLILVKSAVMHIEQRKVIRKTWGSVKNVDKYEIRILYLLGKMRDNSQTLESPLLTNEAEEYDDIVMGNFIDAYTNVTKKSLLGLKFFYEFCRGVEFVMSADDDIFLNTTEMITQHFSKLTHPASQILQCGLRTVKYAKVKRNGKWSIEYEKYNRPFYPPYCLGPCFLMSVDVALATYEASFQTPTDISIDDAMITGILREKIGIQLSSMRKGVCVHLSNSDHVIDKLLKAWNGTF